MTSSTSLRAAFEAALAAAAEAQAAADPARCLAQLERAHLIGQNRFTWHCHAHLRMLAFAIAQRDGREVFGQLLRLSLVPLGHLIGRLPAGNVGSTRMGALETANLPEDIAALLRAEREGRRA